MTSSIVDRLERHLQDHGRMLWRDDVEGHCTTPELCFETEGSVVRCSPCALAQSDAAGVEARNRYHPYSPEECRLNRRIKVLEEALEQGVLWFADYARQHRAKASTGDFDEHIQREAKAQKNAERADYLRQALKGEQSDG